MSNVYYLGRVFHARRLIAWKESAVPKVTDEGWCYDLAKHPPATPTGPVIRRDGKVVIVLTVPPPAAPPPKKPARGRQAGSR